MNDSNAENKILVTEIIYQAPDTGPAVAALPELPPVHPSCRIITGHDLARYAEKLRASGNRAALIKLGFAMMTATGLADLSKVFHSRRN